MLNREEMQDLLEVLTEALSDAESILEDAEETEDSDYIEETEAWFNRISEITTLVKGRIALYDRALSAT
jgi:hypothetical protein